MILSFRPVLAIRRSFGPASAAPRAALSRICRKARRLSFGPLTSGLVYGTRLTALVCGAGMLACSAWAEPGSTTKSAPVTEAIDSMVDAAPRARGPVTNLPLPRFVSLKSETGNARRGPSMSHRIDWVYKRRAMPLEVTAEFGHWRRVRDREGAGGWVHYALLSGVRTVLVEEDMIALRQQPREDARVLARAEAGVVARLGACEAEWCRVSAGAQRGWVPKAALWGVSADELRD